MCLAQKLYGKRWKWQLHDLIIRVLIWNGSNLSKTYVWELHRMPIVRDIVRRQTWGFLLDLVSVKKQMSKLVQWPEKGMQTLRLIVRSDWWGTLDNLTQMNTLCHNHAIFICYQNSICIQPLSPFIQFHFNQIHLCRILFLYDDGPVITTLCFCG